MERSLSPDVFSININIFVCKQIADRNRGAHVNSPMKWSATILIPHIDICHVLLASFCLKIELLFQVKGIRLITLCSDMKVRKTIFAWNLWTCTLLKKKFDTCKVSNKNCEMQGRMPIFISGLHHEILVNFFCIFTVFFDLID